MILLKFILKKYDIDYITEISENYDDYFIHWNIKPNEILFPNIFKNYINESLLRTKPKYIIFPIILHDITESNHIVVFIYNTEIKNLEYFDSMNYNKLYNADLLPNVFINYLKDEFLLLVIEKYININKYNKDNIGIQELQEKELTRDTKSNKLSVIYTIWFIEKRIVLDDQNLNTKIKKELKKNEKNLTVMMLNYKNYLKELCSFKIRDIKENTYLYDDKYIDLCMIIDLIHLYEEEKNNLF